VLGEPCLVPHIGCAAIHQLALAVFLNSLLLLLSLLSVMLVCRHSEIWIQSWIQISALIP
jgi:hypothetical protein